MKAFLVIAVVMCCMMVSSADVEKRTGSAAGSLLTGAGTGTGATGSSGTGNPGFLAGATVGATANANPVLSLVTGLLNTVAQLLSKLLPTLGLGGQGLLTGLLQALGLGGVSGTGTTGGSSAGLLGSLG